MQYASSSGIKSASFQVYNGPGGLCGIDLTPPTSGVAIATVYDGIGATGTVLAECYVDAGQPGLAHEYMIPVAVNRGIYVDLSGSGATYIIRFYPG